MISIYLDVLRILFLLSFLLFCSFIFRFLSFILFFFHPSSYCFYYVYICMHNCLNVVACVDPVFILHLLLQFFLILFYSSLVYLCCSTLCYLFSIAIIYIFFNDFLLFCFLKKDKKEFKRIKRIKFIKKKLKQHSDSMVLDTG